MEASAWKRISQVWVIFLNLGNSWFVVERRNRPDNIQNVVRVAQSNWNLDTLNPAFGRNPSGVTFKKLQKAFFISERQWLGVGLVNMGIYFQGKQIVCHQFYNRGIKIPYTKLNKIPLRYEIEKVAEEHTDAAATATICIGTQIDGEYTPIGTTYSLPANIIQPTTRVDTSLRASSLLQTFNNNIVEQP
jgi:hypothetical protein